MITWSMAYCNRNLYCCVRMQNFMPCYIKAKVYAKPALCLITTRYSCERVAAYTMIYDDYIKAKSLCLLRWRGVITSLLNELSAQLHAGLQVQYIVSLPLGAWNKAVMQQSIASCHIVAHLGNVATLSVLVLLRKSSSYMTFSACTSRSCYSNSVGGRLVNNS